MKQQLRRHDLINALIRKHNYTKYLEIGIADPCGNFDLINCAYKRGVDPRPYSMRHGIIPITSDEFFKNSTEKFDIIFIDGLHQEHQVTNDIINSLTCLNEGGIILTHDNLPETENHMAETQVEAAWFGTGWKSVAKLRMSIRSLSICVLDIDCGVAVIEQGSQELFTKNIGPLRYSTYMLSRIELLNVVPIKNFISSRGLDIDINNYDMWSGSPFKNKITVNP